MIEDEIKKIKSQIKQIPGDTGEQVSYLDLLGDLKWDVCELIPEAKALYNEALAEVSEKVIAEYKEQKVATSILNGIIKGRLKEPQRLVDTLDRMNSTINLQCMNLRTTISYKKGQ